jgi:hypothetical protein
MIPSHKLNGGVSNQDMLLTKDIQPPSNSSDHVMQIPLQRKTQYDQSSTHQRFAEIDHSQARFGFEDAFVMSDVVISERVVEVVSDYLT